jgi:large repetitive protein
LLEVSVVSAGESLPVGATVQTVSSLPGALTLRVAAQAPLGLGASPIEVARLTALVPGTALYRSAQVLSLEIASVTPANPGATARDTVHVIAYLGDTTGNMAYSALDAQRVLRIAVGLDGGFAAYPLISFKPRLLRRGTFKVEREVG